MDSRSGVIRLSGQLTERVFEPPPTRRQFREGGEVLPVAIGQLECFPDRPPDGFGRLALAQRLHHSPMLQSRQAEFGRPDAVITGAQVVLEPLPELGFLHRTGLLPSLGVRLNSIPSATVTPRRTSAAPTG